eukprot:g2760.t1
MASSAFQNPWIYGVVNNSSRPSFFELVLLHRLQEGLQPAFAYTLTVLRRRYAPFKLIARFGPEIFALFSFLVERYYLINFAGSFAENIYGLRRVLSCRKTEKEGKGKFLHKKTVTLSLVALVLLPYLRVKVQQCVEYLRERTDLARASAASLSNAGDTDAWTIVRSSSSLHLLLLKTLQIVDGFANLFDVVCNLFYLVGRSDSFSILNVFAGVSLRRISDTDRAAFSQAIAFRTAEAAANTEANERRARNDGTLALLRFRLKSLIWWALAKAASGIQISLILFAVSFKFFEWYNTPAMESERRRRIFDQSSTQLESLPTPLPPAFPPQRSNAGVPHLHADAIASFNFNPSSLNNRFTKNALCGLCGKKRKNTVASSAGFLFCYSCLFRYVQEHNSCPATGIPCTVEQIRKLSWSNAG